MYYHVLSCILQPLQNFLIFLPGVGSFGGYTIISLMSFILKFVNIELLERIRFV